MPKNCSKDRPPVWSVPGPLPGGDVRAGGRVSSAPSFSPAEEAAAQLELWDAPRQHQRERRERLEQAMDTIRAKYGGRAIQPASAPRDTASTGHDPFPDREGT